MITVTGACGHIGNVVVRQLREKGLDVRAVLLPRESDEPVMGLGCDIVRGDIRDSGFLKNAFRDSGAVIHLAGMVSVVPGRKKALESVNVEGTARVIETVQELNVGRLVYISSIHALAVPDNGSAVYESFDFDEMNALGDYGKSKARASIMVEKAAKNGLNAVILCPTGIMGPYDYKLSQVGQMLLFYMGGRLPFCIGGSYDFADVRDVAGAIVSAIDHGRPGQKYILSGGLLTVRDIIHTVCETMGRKGPFLALPERMVRFLARIGDRMARLSGRELALTSESLEILKTGGPVSCGLAVQELNYHHRPVRESVQDAVLWLAGRRGMKVSGRIACARII